MQCICDSCWRIISFFLNCVLPGSACSRFYSPLFPFQGSWNKAGVHLKHSLATLGVSPCFEAGKLSTFWAKFCAYSKGLRFVLYHLPLMLWLHFTLSRSDSAAASKKTSKKVDEQPEGGDASVTVTRIRRRLLELKFLSELILPLRDIGIVCYHPSQCDVIA